MHSICLVGPFPPPTHGMAAVNLAMRDFLISLGEDPIVFDLSAKTLSRAWRVRISRAARVLCAFGKYVGVLLGRGNVSVYLSLSAGYGQLYEIIFILAGRLFRARIFIHHHSFLYLDKRRVLMRVLLGLAGRASRHIVLCDIMAAKLKSHYPPVRQVTVLSNSVWLPSPINIGRPRNELSTLGFLGNIEGDKGIFEFLAVVQKIQDEWHEIRAVIAGPFQDKKIEKLVRDKIKQLRNVQYVGAKYGSEKSEFFEAIDVLLYPTRNDAEPLTILEAMRHGVPVVAWSRGCIPAMLPMSSELVIDGNDDYVLNALNRIRVWQESPSKLGVKSRAIKDKYKGMQLEAKKRLDTLYSQLVFAK